MYDSILLSTDRGPETDEPLTRALELARENDVVHIFIQRENPGVHAGRGSRHTDTLCP